MKAMSLETENSLAGPGQPSLRSQRTVAMFLLGLRLQVGVDVINRLTPDEQQRVADAISDLELIDRTTHDELPESQSIRANRELLSNLGWDYALHMVREALIAESRRHGHEFAPPDDNLVCITSAFRRETSKFLR
jgi:hypothetical protein